MQIWKDGGLQRGRDVDGPLFVDALERQLDDLDHLGSLLRLTLRSARVLIAEA